MNRSEQGATLDEVITGLREDAPLRNAVAVVVGPTDPLQERGDVARRRQLTYQIDRADIDAELQ